MPASTRSAHLGIESRAEIIGGHADAHPADRLVQCLGVVRDWHIGRGGVQGIAPGHHGKHGSGVAHVSREGADTVERGSEGDQAVARDAPVGRHHSGNAAEGARLANRAASIGAQRGHRQTGGHGRGGASAGTARHAVKRHRIAHRTISGIFVGAAHGELIAVGLSQHHGPGALQALDGRGVVSRPIAREDARAARGGHAARAEYVLDGQWQPGQRRQGLFPRHQRVHAIGLGQGAFGREREVGVQLGVALLDAGEELGGQLARGDALGSQRLAHRGDGPVAAVAMWVGCWHQFHLEHFARRLIVRSPWARGNEWKWLRGRRPELRR